MSAVTLDAMVRRLSRMAEEIFRDTGEIDPLWLVDIPGEGQQVIISPINAPSGEAAAKYKMLLTDAMREMFAARGVTRYVYVSECWTVEEKQPSAGHNSLATHPDRQEAIVIQAEDGHQVLMAIRTITRPATGKPYLSKLAIERADGMRGRFSGLLSGPRLKPTSELPDDEGAVYITAVPDAPFQVTGRRADNGELYISSEMHPGGGKTMQDILRSIEQCNAEVGPFEILTGAEAERLIAAVAKSRPVLQ